MCVESNLTSKLTWFLIFWPLINTRTTFSDQQTRLLKSDYSRQSNIKKKMFSLYDTLNQVPVVLNPLLWLPNFLAANDPNTCNGPKFKEVFSDSNNIILWHDINKKAYFQNCSWFQFYVFKLYAWLCVFYCSHRLNCSHFTLKCFQPYSFGEVCFLEERYENMPKIQILTILRAPSSYLISGSMPFKENKNYPYITTCQI